MSGNGTSLNQLLTYYRGFLPPSWLSHVSTEDDLCDALALAKEKGAAVPSIEKASEGIANGESYFTGSDPASSKPVGGLGGTSEQEGGNDFRYSARVVTWDDMQTEGEYGSKLTFGNHGSVLLNDGYQLAIENAGPGCALLAVCAPEARLGGVLVLPHILDMKSKREHHLAQKGAASDSSLFAVRGNDSVFHLQADVADRIGAQQCLYSLEMYKFIKGFAKQGLGMNKIKAAFLFIDGTLSASKSYGTPPPLVQQYIGAALMLGVRVSSMRFVSTSGWPGDEPLLFDPAAQKLVLRDRTVLNLDTSGLFEIKKFFNRTMRFRDEMFPLVRSKMLRDRMWTYHIPMAIGLANGSTFSLAARYRSLKRAINQYPKRPHLEPWLVSRHAYWQEEVPGIV